MERYYIADAEYMTTEEEAKRIAESLVTEEVGNIVSVKKEGKPSFFTKRTKALVDSYIRMPDQTVKPMSGLTEQQILNLVEQGIIEP